MSVIEDNEDNEDSANLSVLNSKALVFRDIDHVFASDEVVLKKGYVSKMQVNEIFICDGVTKNNRQIFIYLQVTKFIRIWG